LSVRSKGDAGGAAGRKKPDSPPVWRLPSGQSLAEFAVGAGLIASGLLESRTAWPDKGEVQSGRGGRKPAPERQ
jgi:hypothetical protein